MAAFPSNESRGVKAVVDESQGRYDSSKARSVGMLDKLVNVHHRMALPLETNILERSKIETR
jgi:hypothetical protein